MKYYDKLTEEIRIYFKFDKNDMRAQAYDTE